MGLPWTLGPEGLWEGPWARLQAKAGPLGPVAPCPFSGP